MTSHHHPSKPKEETHDAKSSSATMAGALGKEVSSKETIEQLEQKIEALELEHEKIKAQSEENWHKFLEAVAAKDNEKKRLDRDAEQKQKFAVEKITIELLPVLDTLERALQSSEACALESITDDATRHFFQAMHDGVALTVKMFEGVLAKFGVTQIDPHGDVFDPLHHEAMTTSQHEKLPNNHVSEVIQKGYLLNNRLVRPARVIVNKQKNDG